MIDYYSSTLNEFRKYVTNLEREAGTGIALKSESIHLPKLKAVLEFREYLDTVRKSYMNLSH